MAQVVSKSFDSRCSIVVMSCDAHDDVAAVSAKMLRQFWPDCPFESLLVNEVSDCTAGFDRVVTPGKLAWSARLAAALESTTSPYVMLMCDDYLVADLVNTAQVLSRLDDAKRLDVLNLRLATSPASKGYLRSFGENGLVEYPKDKPYCIATQPGLWNRESLLRLAKATNSAWDFERKGSQMASDDKRPILSTAVCEFAHVDSVRRGLWYPPAVAFCVRNGIVLDLERRPQQSFSTRLYWLVRDGIYGLAPQLCTRLSTWWTSGR